MNSDDSSTHLSWGAPYIFPHYLPILFINHFLSVWTDWINILHLSGGFIESLKAVHNSLTLLIYWRQVRSIEWHPEWHRFILFLWCLDSGPLHSFSSVLRLSVVCNSPCAVPVTSSSGWEVPLSFCWLDWQFPVWLSPLCLLGWWAPCLPAGLPLW